MTKEDYERIKRGQEEAFNKIETLNVAITKIKDDILELSKKQADIIVELKDYKIEDITQDEEIKKKIQDMASSSGRKTAFKWIAGIVPAVEIIRQVLENI